MFLQKSWKGTWRGPRRTAITQTDRRQPTVFSAGKPAWTLQRGQPWTAGYILREEISTLLHLFAARKENP